MAKILTVHAFRGGAGATNITANLAATLALQGHRVGVIDTDMEAPGIHVLFGLKGGTVHRTLNDVLWAQCSIAEAAHDVTGALLGGGTSALVAEGGLSLVPASENTGEIVRVLKGGYDVARLLNGFRQMMDDTTLDYVLVDTHPGMGEEALLAISICDVALIVMSPDRQDYQGTAVLVALARKLQVPSVLLLVNKVVPSLDAGAVRQTVQEKYRVPVVGVMPLCEEMARLASNGLFALRHPQHPWTQEIRAAAHWIAGD